MKLHRLILFLGGFLLIVNTSQAQKFKTTLAPEADFNIPIGSSNNALGVGFGFDGQVQFPIKKSGFSILARTGVDIFTGKTTNIGFFSYTSNTQVSIPILFGGRYYFVDGLHSDLELGLRLRLVNGAGAAFNLAPSIGYLTHGFDPFIRFSSSFLPGGSFFDFGARYQFKL